MKKMTLTLAVLSVALVPTLLMAQPPRPHSSQVPQGRPQPVQNSTMRVHVPQQAVPARNILPNRGPHQIPTHQVAPYRSPQPRAYYSPGYYPLPHPQPYLVPQSVVVVPQVVPPVVTPYYYVPVQSGVSLTIGGKHGSISIYSGN